jgi:hypothetical protein
VRGQGLNRSANWQLTLLASYNGDCIDCSLSTVPGGEGWGEGASELNWLLLSEVGR